jgi:metal-sulfur cluster biosynthetic enzyme
MTSPDLTQDIVLDALRGIEDPEVGTGIVDLGLVYGVDIDENGVVTIKMTTTTRFCPASGFIVDAVRTRIEQIDCVTEVVVDLVYDPPWSPEMSALFSLEPL